MYFFVLFSFTVMGHFIFGRRVHGRQNYGPQLVVLSRLVEISPSFERVVINYRGHLLVGKSLFE